MLSINTNLSFPVVLQHLPLSNGRGQQLWQSFAMHTTVGEGQSLNNGGEVWSP